jgi:hypothetical protein
MGFPLSIGNYRVTNGPDLVDIIIADVGHCAVVPGQNPAQWVLALLTEGELNADEIRGLAAALIQQGTPATVAVGSRLARSLRDSALGPLLLHALGGLDVGLLLALDPLGDGTSLEDTLIRAAVDVVDSTDDTMRSSLLGLLRNASLPGLELDILAKHGSVADVHRWLPAILAEHHETAMVAALRGLGRRGQPFQDAVAVALSSMPEVDRNRVLRQLRG